MRISVTNFWLIVFLLTAFGCGKKMDTASSESSSDEWPEMDSFHMIMAEAFHPYKDSSNVEPAKKMVEEMAQAAASWQAAPLPDKVNNDEVKAQSEFDALMKDFDNLVTSMLAWSTQEDN